MNKEILNDVPINQLVPYENNYLDHKDNIIHVKNSIKDFGYNKVSIGIDEKGELLYGHCTLQALKELDYENVPMVLEIKGLTEEQKKAFRIADNESARKAEIIMEKLDIEMQYINIDMKQYGLDIMKPLDLDSQAEDFSDLAKEFTDKHGDPALKEKFWMFIELQDNQEFEYFKEKIGKSTGREIDKEKLLLCIK